MIDSYRYDNSDLLDQRKFALAALVQYNTIGREAYEFCDEIIKTGIIADLIEKYSEGGDMMAAFSEVNSLYQIHLENRP
tara:strand:- start:206 stop:442 length:237 start_codon:yes stop_codon:yes gene_type:complete